MTSLSDALAEERRARLAAERLLELKQAELLAANEKLSLHARSLSNQIIVKREETEALRDLNETVRCDLERAEAQLWQALQTVRDGFAIFDTDSRLTVANDSYLAIFDGLDCVGPGVRYGDIVDVLLEEGIVDTQGEPAADWRARVMARWNEEAPDPEVIRLWNGQFIKLIDRRMADGGRVSLGLNMTDMMRMWAAVETIPDGFVLYDQDDRLVMCNDRYREIYARSTAAIRPGATFEEILRHGLERGQYAEAIGREDEWLEERLVRHRAADSILEQQLEDGRWLRVFERPTPDGGRVGLRVDITDMKQQEAALRLATERAEAASRAKSAFLANMSHEIRTPMNGVVGMADLLAETDLDDDQQLYIRTIRSSAEALLVLINDVLDYSKIEAQKLTLNPAEFDLEQCVHDVVTLIQPSAQAKSIDMMVDYDMFLPTRFVGDRGRIRQILTNLIGNAVKFTPEGHVVVRIVGLPCEDGRSQRVHISIEDTGIGIPADKIDHVFGEFNQVEDERNRHFEGTGLGLAITRRLVDLMGGEIWVDSVEGEGACFGFHLTMPVVEPADGLTGPVPDWLGRAAVVDGREVNRRILEKQFAALGVAVDTFATGRALLSSGAAQEADVFLFDCRLEDVDAADFVHTLRADGVIAPCVMTWSSRPPSPRIDIEGVRVVPTPILRRDLLATICDLDPAAPAATAPTEGRRMRVLAAEDNKTNRLVFEKMLRRLDIDLVFATDGAEAIAAFDRHRPDLVFMDISMPGVDGKEATRAIRDAEAEAGAGRTTIVALTAHAMKGDDEEILAAGLDGYLTKPLSKDAILERIRAACPPGCRPVEPREPDETSPSDTAPEPHPEAAVPAESTDHQSRSAGQA